VTLIAGFRCTDGFVIAADTAVTLDSIVYQGSKLIRHRLDDPFKVCIAMAGDVYAIEAAQNIVAALRTACAETRQAPTFAEATAIVNDVVTTLYDEKMLRQWHLIGAPNPWMSLIIGYLGEDGFGVLKTDQNSVHEVTGYAFEGAGRGLAAYVAERLFNMQQLSTAITHQLAQQLFRAVKDRATYVGGNSEILGRRCVHGAQHFFKTPSLEKAPKLALWSLEANLMSGIRTAMNPNHIALPGMSVSEVLAKRLHSINEYLTALHKDSHDPDCVIVSDELHTTEFGTDVGYPFTDL
jgi:20S proteasome alpha/beta subunit